MSYDLQVWSTSAINLRDALPDGGSWRAEKDVFVWSRRGWQIVVGPQHRVEFEDVPHGVHATLPGIQYMTELNLEPISAPQTARTLLRRVAKALAASGYGAVVDVQTGEITTPAGVRRVMTAPRTSVLDELELSWFSAEQSVCSRDWLRELVDCLEVGLPEALPVRYGQYEPPPYRLRETGREHFIDFLAAEYLEPQNLGFAVWYPRRPILDVHLSLGAGPSRHGWRCNRLTVTVEAAVLEQPGWPSALVQLWRRVAHLMRAFYADVRTLTGYRPGGATFEELMKADRHPVCSSFWAGIPHNGGHAVALGPPYVALWPEFQRAGEIDGDMVFLCEENWRSYNHDVFERVGGVPDALSMQSSGYAQGQLGPNLAPVYPPVWPFGMTHVEPR